MPPTIAKAQAYQAAYDYFNKAVFAVAFEEPLPHAVLNFSRKGHANAFFAPDRWRDVRDGSLLAEISMCPEATDRPLKDVFATLCHEMAHFKDQLDGKPGKNGYHARTWFKYMKQIGLPGRALSASKVAVSHDVEPGGLFERAFEQMPESIKLPFVGSVKWQKVKKPTLQGVRFKYVCVSCGEHVRGKAELNIRCGDCDMQMICEGI